MRQQRPVMANSIKTLQFTLFQQQQNLFRGPIGGEGGGGH